jgi:hypothetical protein
MKNKINEKIQTNQFDVCKGTIYNLKDFLEIVIAE